MDIKSRYEKLFELVSSPKSIDCGRGTIYQFPKYCKACGTGMKKVQRHDKRTVKSLYRKSYCSEGCVAAGPNLCSTFTYKVKSQYSPSKKAVHLVEEMAFAALEMARKEVNRKGFGYLVRYADKTFQLLSEKLAYLENVTGQTWGKSKFYWWLRER